MISQRVASLCAGVALIVFTAPALAGGQIADLSAFKHLIDAASAHRNLAATTTTGPKIMAASDARPSADFLRHEGKAAALWSGRILHARGKPLDSRSTEVRVDAALIGAPLGWKLDGTKLIHQESGLECPASFTLPSDSGDRVLALNTVTGYDQRGRDVSCDYGIDGDATITVYASYYPAVTLEEHAMQAVSAIRRNFTVIGELPVTTVVVEPKDGRQTTELPEALSGAFDVGEINGVPYKTAIWIAKTHGWHVKGRATYAQTDFMSELTAAVLFGVNYVNVDMKSRVDPTGPGPEV